MISAIEAMKQAMELDPRFSEYAFNIAQTYELLRDFKNAEFYYNSGKIKIKGQYKKGIKTGKWKYYAESGELLTKDNWKKHYKENK